MDEAEALRKAVREEIRALEEASAMHSASQPVFEILKHVKDKAPAGLDRAHGDRAPSVTIGPVRVEVQQKAGGFAVRAENLDTGTQDEGMRQTVGEAKDLALRMWTNLYRNR